MNKKLSKPLYDLALQVGGSHYPEVAKAHLEATVKLVVEQCAKYAQNPNAEQLMKQHWGIEESNESRATQ
jgi:hypothetical protein